MMRAFQISNLKFRTAFARPPVGTRRRGFTLIEVVLALGVFLVTVLALVGLLGPTLKSLEEVERADEAASVVSTVNAFLQSSPAIAPGGGSRFDVVYSAVKADDHATVFVFRRYVDASSTEVGLVVGFDAGESVAGGLGIGAGARVANFDNAAGPIYRVVLSASSALPAPAGEEEKYRSSARDADTGIYRLNAGLDAFEEGYFAMEVRIFAEDPPAPGGVFASATDLSALAGTEPIFTYDTAIVR